MFSPMRGSPSDPEVSAAPVIPISRNLGLAQGQTPGLQTLSMSLLCLVLGWPQLEGPALGLKTSGAQEP